MSTLQKSPETLFLHDMLFELFPSTHTETPDLDSEF